MIWRSRTCSSLLLLAVSGLLQAGTVSGRVELRDSKDASVRRNQFGGVVVWLEPAGTTAPVAALNERARMLQKDKAFSPHVLPVRVGTTVDFPNFDPIFHNAFSNYNGQLFDVGLYPPGTSRSVRFSRPGVVRVFCNIHATMSAVIVVLGTPYFATTSSEGTWEIRNVPPGDYSLRVFHERATQPMLEALTRRVTVGAEPLAIPLLTISESGYLALPHTNKFGHEYGTEPDEHGGYASPKK